MQGIYIIKNNINNKVYIGQSVNILQRWYKHRSSARCPSSLEYNSQLHTAMREFGIENFYYEILEEIPLKEELDEREKYWIKYYNSFKNGYNASIGGKIYEEASKGESNGRAKLKEEDVFYIREMYNAHIPFREAYAKYKDKIGKRGFQHIWYFENWKDILPEYNTPENKKWHSTIAKANSYEVASNNKRAFTKEEILDIRKRYENGEAIVDIWRKDFSHLSLPTVRNAIKKKTYKDID